MDNNPVKNVDDEKKFLMEYQEVGNFIRHYSSIRSALTSFLVTLALASFLTYFQTTEKNYFLIVVGHIMIIVAIAVCLIFSYRTENSNLYLTLIWKWFDGDSENAPIGFKNFKGGIKTLKKMGKDLMNWILLWGALSIVIAFWILFG